MSVNIDRGGWLNGIDNHFITEDMQMHYFSNSDMTFLLWFKLQHNASHTMNHNTIWDEASVFYFPETAYVTGMNVLLEEDTRKCKFTAWSGPPTNAKYTALEFTTTRPSWLNEWIGFVCQLTYNTGLN
jgi:hypothetical protein